MSPEVDNVLAHRYQLDQGNLYDFIVIGSGIAGLYTALLAEQHGRVLLLTKAGLDDSNTNDAQGGIAAAVGADDWPALHWRDTLDAGAGLTDPAAAWVLAHEAPERIADLIRFGVPFDREDEHLALAQEGAHSRPRVLHAGGDATGAKIQATLGRLAVQARNITVREHHLVTDLVVSEGSVRGVLALDCRSCALKRYSARVVVLATGGAGQLYLHTTNPTVATGTGLALAYRAGAGLADLEFCQFHPTALALPNAPHFLISEAARGEGGILVTSDRRRFMFDYDPRGELAPRHIVASAIMAEMACDGAPSVYLDLSHLPAGQILRRFPVIAAFCRQLGIDITTSPIPVAPAAHYMMGGVRTNLYGETDLPGLFACGEVACTGVHGGNRLASNSLLEALVFGSRIVQRTTGAINAAYANLEVPEARWLVTGSREQGRSDDARRSVVIHDDCRFGPDVADFEAQPTTNPLVNTHVGYREFSDGELRLADVQALMWAEVGMSRSKRSLERARKYLAQWESCVASSASGSEHELRDLLLVARLVTMAALAREETRGAHHRTDFPVEDESWLRRLVFHAPRARIANNRSVPAIR